jgi:hypothetical protein
MLFTDLRPRLLCRLCGHGGRRNVDRRLRRGTGWRRAHSRLNLQTLHPLLHIKEGNGCAKRAMAAMIVTAISAISRCLAARNC